MKKPDLSKIDFGSLIVPVIMSVGAFVGAVMDNKKNQKMKNLRKEIREFYHNYYSEKDKFIEDRFKKKIENLILIIEKET